MVFEPFCSEIGCQALDETVVMCHFVCMPRGSWAQGLKEGRKF